MSNIAIWNGTSHFTTGSTPFGFYDTDNLFVTESDQVAKWCAQRLGYPLVEVELQPISFYAAFEEAVTTYGNEVYQWKVRENYLSMEGNKITNNFNNALITPNLGTNIRISETYATEAGTGGKVPFYSGSFVMNAGQQDYDLDAILQTQGITGSVEIKRVFYEAPPAIVRYFDPYAGTGTGMQSLLETFGFGQMSPGINFLLMPIFFDVMKVQAIELNDQIRKAAFSFDLRNNQLKIFPIPIPAYDGAQLWFEYITLSQKSQPVRDNRANIVTDIMNVPYRNPVYSQINAVGRLWILKYCLALCREIEAHIRIQFANLNIQGVGPLQGNELIADARTEKDNLINELKEMLNEVSRKSQLERKQQEAEFTRDTLTNIPLNIYIM
jgi:hypothetical protein